LMLVWLRRRVKLGLWDIGLWLEWNGLKLNINLYRGEKTCRIILNLGSDPIRMV
jgi:hypothetical protein